MQSSGAQDFIVRALTAADLPYLRELNLLFADAFHEPEQYRSAPPSDG